MNGAFDFLKTLGAARLGAMGAVAVGLVGFFAFLIMRLSEPQMVTLYSELDNRDSSAIIRELESSNIPFELRVDGTVILVPKENVLRLRMQLAEDGLPLGGSVGYEIFDSSDGLGTTSFVQNINHLRALEGELSRTIRALDRIDFARVHLVLKQREVFSRDTSEPSASIVIKTRGDIESGSIRAIQHIVASAVNGLSASMVSIVDETGRLLASPENGNDPGAIVSSLNERTVAIETRIRDQILNIVESIVGPGHSRVNVAATLNYNRVTLTSDTYDPEGRVVRSTQSREETSSSQGSGSQNGVSISNELPGADGSSATNAGGASDNTEKTEEIVNYEISRITKTEILEAGQIERISVAVLLDGTYSTSDAGEVSYQPLSQEKLDQISALVRTTIGFNQQRGDQIEVSSMQFVAQIRPEFIAEEDAFLELNKDDYFYIAELAVLLIISALVLLFVVRPLVRRILTPDEGLGAGMLGAAGVAGAAGAVAFDANGNPMIAAGEDFAKLAPPDSLTSEAIDTAQVAGQAQADTLRKVGEIVDSNPDEAVTIIRQWIGEAA
ncbi:MAG: flagellar M-ring protein FliF [Rhizobiales bacterium]|nr:flagellar M-ring protein FliF [Hyphomicrobiales bacterium]